MKNLFRVSALLIMGTILLEQASMIGRTEEVHDMEYLVLQDRAKERAERVRNRYEGRSPSIGSNHERQ